MSNATSQHELQTPSCEILPGTTFPPTNGPTAYDKLETSIPHSCDGPEVNGRPTTLTLFSPPQLDASPLLPSLYSVVNDAFHTGNEREGTRIRRNRLAYDGQLRDELGNKPGTFSYVLSYTGTNDIVATASAKPYALAQKIALVPHNLAKMQNGDTTWKRLVSLGEDKEVWELSTMAVDPRLQRQGLAGYLMKLTEDEVKRRFLAGPGGGEKQLIMAITTVKERMGPFYLRRGFKEDYEIGYPQGHLGSVKAFTVVFMSKIVEV